MADKLFSIVCETCSARLQVRDASVIGQILNCPKCQSMVLVTAPVGWVAPKPNAIDSTTAANLQAGFTTPAKAASQPTKLELTKSSAAESWLDEHRLAETRLAEPSAAQPKTPLAESRVTGAEPRVAGAESAKSRIAAKTEPITKSPAPATTKTQPLIPPSHAASASAHAASPAGVTPAAVVPPPLPADLVESIAPPTARLSRQWIGLVAGIGVGALLGAGAIWMAFRGGDDQPVVDPSTHTAAVEPTTPPSDSAPTETPKPADAPVVKTPPVDKQSPKKSPAEKQPAEKPPAPETKPNDIKPADTKPVDAKPVDAVPPSASTKPTEVKPDAAQPPTPKPIETKPAETTPVEKPAEKPAEAPVPAAPPKPQRPPLATVDVPARLAERVNRLEFKRVPLYRLLDTFSAISTIPITLDIEALRDAGLSADALVTLQHNGGPLSKALDQSLAGLKLAYNVVDGQLVIAPAAGPQLPVTVHIDLNELASGDEGPFAIVDLIRDLVVPTEAPGAAEKTTLEPRGRQLVVRGAPATVRAIEQLVMRLRAARRAATQRDGDSSLLQTRYVAAKTSLAGAVRINQPVPVSFAKVIARLRTDARLHLVVDWRALAELNIGPTTEIRAVAPGQSLEAALATILEPLDLGYCLLDGKSLQITSLDALVDRPQVELIPLADRDWTPAAVDDWLKKFRASLPAKWRDADAVAVYRYDAPSKTLLVRHAGPVLMLLEQQLRQPPGAAK